MGADDVATPRQPPDLLEGAPAEHQGVTHRHLLETAEVRADVPQHVLSGADDAVVGDGSDGDDLHGILLTSQSDGDRCGNGRVGVVPRELDVGELEPVDLTHLRVDGELR